MTPGPCTTLPNGLRVILAENQTVPLVFLSWTSPAGFACAPPGLEGIASFVPPLMREGTARRSGERISQALDDLCAELAVGCDWEYAFLNVGLLSDDFAAAADLVIDMACAPRFPPAAVERLRQKRLAALAQGRRDARTIAGEVFARALFGSSVYAVQPLGTAASLARIEAADLVGFHRAHYGPAQSYLVVAGSFDREQIITQLGSLDLPASAGHAAAVARPTASARASRGGCRLVDIPHATQTEIRIGQGGIAPDSEHLPALEVCHVMLGSGPDSRLARRVRQRLGLTYDIRSRLLMRRLGAAFTIETSVAHDAAGAALTAIRREIDTLAEERVPAEDVEQAKRRLVGADLRKFQDLIGLGASLGPMALQRDHMNQFERRKHAIAAVGPDEVRDAVRRCLDPGQLVSVLAGPAAVLRSIDIVGGNAKRYTREGGGNAMEKFVEIEPLVDATAELAAEAVCACGCGMCFCIPPSEE